MARASRGRLVAGVALGATLLVAVATVACWPALERRIHLLRLRREPALLEGMLLATGDARRGAADDFIREPAGRRELLRLYLLELDRNVSGAGLRDSILRDRGNASRRGLVALMQEGFNHQSWTVGTRSHASYSMTHQPEDATRRRIILEKLELLAGEVLTVPGFEGLEFQVRTTVGGPLAPPRWDGAAEGQEWLPWSTPTVPPGVRVVCYYRVVPAP